MIVRCGRCRVDLEVAGPGEFICPNCGTRNAVRGPASQPAEGLFGVPDLGSAAAPSQNPEGSDVRWIRCPGCSYRFAVGSVEEVDCPACSRHLRVSEDGVDEAAAG